MGSPGQSVTMDAENTNAADTSSSSAQRFGRVTADDLRRLLATGQPDAYLVLEEGQIRIEGAFGSEPQGMLILSRAELAARIGEDPDAAALTQTAAELETEVRLRGA
ncbi:hypothetical protein [Nocardia sp. NPDC004750]